MNRQQINKPTARLNFQKDKHSDILRQNRQIKSSIHRYRPTVKLTDRHINRYIERKTYRQIHV